MRALILALLLAGCASAQSAQKLTAARVIAAERAFAAEAAERGWAAAFRAWHAPGAIVLQPDPIEAATTLARIQGDGETNLDWRPAYAGIARSGDFGFTTGPFQFRGRDGIVGHYFTVWRRQRDGTWKWIFDAGTDVADPEPAVAVDAAIPTLPVAAGGTGMAEAIAEVRALERFIATARPEPRAQLIRRLAEDVRLNRPGRRAAIGREAAAAAARETALDASADPLRVEASAAGDLVFVLARTSWPEGDARREGFYARIWQWRAGGWAIVFDEIVPRRAPRS